MKTIIIIEDNRHFAIPLARILHAAGYEIVCLYTHQDAWNYLRPLIKSDISYIAAFIFDYILDPKTQPITTSAALLNMVKRHINFKGIILANSGENDSNVLLQRLGCTHTRPGCEKKYAAAYLLELLKEK